MLPIQMGLRFLFYVGMISILIFTVAAVDQRFEACKPRNCGSGPDISYPFYIFNSGTDFCGYTGFGIFCDQKKPLFRTSKSDYFIEDISYETQSFRLVNQEVVESTSSSSCVAPLDFFQFDTPSIKFTAKLADLVLFYNCTKKVPLPYPHATVACASTASNYSVAVLNAGSVYWNSEKMVEEMACERYVGAPVDWEGRRHNQTEEEAIDYVGLLKNGFTLEWTGTDCDKCRLSGGRCGFDENNDAVCFCSDRPHTTHCNNGNNKRLRIAVGLAISVIGVGILLTLTFYLRRKFASILWEKQTRKHLINVEAFLRNHGSLALKRYRYSEVKKMTNSFKDKVGEGGYGIVYKGKLLSGDLVAVKILKETKGNGEEFINEIATISKTSHVNIVSLLGFCFQGSKRALIYEFMPNGSLEKFIYDKNSSTITGEKLGWETLYNISIGIARGLEYLHRGCNARILHFDIKPHNILLNQDFCPKISDFGLSKLCTQKESIISMSCARGTIGYIAPEVFCRNFGDVSPKSDVYSYGMMVLEMVGGRQNIAAGVDHTSEIYFPHWIYKRFELHEELELLQGFMNEEERMRARMMIIVSLWCIQTNPSNRPSMSQVVDMLEGSLESLQIPPKPFLYSPPRSMGDYSYNAEPVKA